MVYKLCGSVEITETREGMLMKVWYKSESKRRIGEVETFARIVSESGSGFLAT